MGSEMYMGVCKHKKDNKFRRIDIKVYPQDQFAFALLYFTGSGEFNREMRTHAEELGYTLSDHGLKKISTGNFVECKTEEEIFTALKRSFVEPKNRDL